MVLQSVGNVVVGSAVPFVWVPGMDGDRGRALSLPCGIRRCSVQAAAVLIMAASTMSRATFSCPRGMPGLGTQLLPDLLWGH